MTISGSAFARQKLTHRNSPSQDGLPAGSCSRTSRPLPNSWPAEAISALTATENGAILAGAGISSTESSGRQGMVNSVSTAISNSGGTSRFWPTTTP